MMTLDYGTLLCPDPIELSIVTIRKPTLRQIYKLTFSTFYLFESFLKMTPNILYTEILDESQRAYWESLNESEKESISLYSIVINDDKLRSIYYRIFEFFFVDQVIEYDNHYIILKNKVDNDQAIDTNNIKGIITDESFQQILDILQQICCVYEKPASAENLKFKNKTAQRLYEKLSKAREDQRKRSGRDSSKELALPNIISAVSNRHYSITPISVWELTVFQLVDSFNRLQLNAVYEINQTRVSVWGDEKNNFDSTLWYKNNNDDVLTL